MNNVRYIELLAPAKNLAVGRVAIDSGADAVYIGGPSFGARQAAGNSVEDIAELCRYAHLFDARVFVTLNTLLRDDEYDEAVRLAYSYKSAGADAILIQDLRLARILLETGDFNGRLHASTQCDNRTLERVQELEAMGFSQVVLARELSYDAMRAIYEHTHVALEAFVHGALCVSYSGACYLSEAVLGRSANRGACAQMCRLTYDVLDEQGRELQHQKHILSLYDLDRSQHLRELLETGVTTLKIEGRLKDADYVRNVTAYYRQLLDRLFLESDGRYAQASSGITRIQFKPDPAKTFHRGATESFSFDRPANLVNQDTPKSTGEFLGRAPIQPTWPLHNGDGLVAGEQGFYWPSRQRIPAGTPVYRTYDAEFQRQLAAKDATSRVLPVILTLRETPTGFSLEIKEHFRTSPKGGSAHEVIDQQGEQPKGHLRTAAPAAISLSFPAEKIPASNPDRAEALVRTQLAKLGNTPLEAAEVRVLWSQPYFLSAATLNDWRRQAVEAFLNTKSAPINSSPNIGVKLQATPFLADKGGCASKPTNRQACIESLSQVPALPAEGYPPAPPTSATSPTAPSAPLPNALMTCKYCILNELGCCKTRAPRKSGIPTYLRRGDLLLRIQTDCNACEMKLIKA